MNISNNINTFLLSRGYYDRYSSFDFCYSYFYKFYKNNNIKDIASNKNIEHSSLHIGFYLASWGMMRGSSFLLQKSLGIIKDLVIEISKLDKSIRNIDINNYSDDNIDKILNTYSLIKNIFLKHGYNPTETLITKIMLGVFGNIPAFDRYFRDGMNVHSVNKKNLQKIYNFYIENQKELDSFKIRSFDFNSEKESNIYYTKAKIIDMYGFSKGFNQKN